jgi:hypothetical protein|tara:strand:+ start:246 stop:377 length:132 start_codon:yes stop_codon:yes gene_type:complete
MNMGVFLMLGFMGGALLAEVVLKGGVPIPAIFVNLFVLNRYIA